MKKYLTMGLMAMVMTAWCSPILMAMDNLSPVTELMLFSDEVMVMSATKRLQKLSEVPGSVTIITGKEIKESGALTIYEALRNMTDVVIINEGLFDSLRFRGMQSAYNNKILVLVDGRKINTMDIGNYDGKYGTDLSNVKQIEVIKGPGSSLYGANAYAGVINIVTKDGADIGGVKTDISLANKPGDFEISQKYNLAYGGKKGTLDYKVTAGYWRALGVDPVNVDHPNDLYTGADANFKLKFKDDWMVQGGYLDSTTPWDGSTFTPTPRNHEKQDMLYLDGTYKLELNDLSSLKVHLTDNYYADRMVETETWDLHRKKINSIADFPSLTPSMIFTDQGQIELPDNALGQYYIGVDDLLRVTSGSALEVVDLGKGRLNELVLELQYDLAWPQNNYLLAGINFNYNWVDQNYILGGQVTDQNYAVYLQDEYHLADRLIMLSGLRYDYNQDYGSDLSPRESLIYEPFKGLRFKALYGSAFRAPVFLERYTKTNYGFYEANGNPDLKPESVQQSEASVEYESGKWLRAKAAYFYWETANEIQFAYTLGSLYVYSPDLSLISPLMPAAPGLFYTDQLNIAPAFVSWDNSNSRIGHGLELEITIAPTEFTRIQLNYSRVNLYGRKKPVAPEWAEGVSDIANAVLGLHYQDLLFLNFYAHTARVPVAYGDDFLDIKGKKIESKWTQQYDVSLGCKIGGLSVVVAALDIFNNPLDYNEKNGDYLRGKPLCRINASYTLGF